MADDYDLVPHRVVSDLKKDIEDMKKNPLGGTGSGKDLLSGINDLNTNLNTMIELFKDASESLKLEEKEDEIIGKKIDPMIEKLDQIIDQNKKIAQGIVAVADMISEKLAEIAEVKPAVQPQQAQMPMQPMMGMPQMQNSMPEMQNFSVQTMQQQLDQQKPMQMPPMAGMQMPGRGIEGQTKMPGQIPSNLPPLGNVDTFPNFNVPAKPAKKKGLFG